MSMDKIKKAGCSEGYLYQGLRQFRYDYLNERRPGL